jgi:hypothetical protein
VVPESTPSVAFVSPQRARALCGQRLDWIESVAR